MRLRLGTGAPEGGGESATMVAVESEDVLVRLDSMEALAGLVLELDLEIEELDGLELESEFEEEGELELDSLGGREALFKVALDLDLVSACSAGTSESMDEALESSEDVDMAAFETLLLLVCFPSDLVCLVERSKFVDLGSSTRSTAFEGPLSLSFIISQFTYNRAGR